MLGRWWRWALVLACGLGVARTSAAEPTADERARLEELLRTGADAKEAKKWSACVDALWDALAIEDSPTTAGDLGLCEEQVGRFGDAMNHVFRALAAATPSMRDKEPWKSYQAASDRLITQVAMVGIRVHPPHAWVVIDGRPHGKADGQVIALSHGKHTIVARAEGYEDASDTRLVTASGVPNIHLDLKPKPKAASTVTPPAAATAATEAPASAVGPPVAGPRPELLNPCRMAPSASGVLGPLACGAAMAFVVTGAVAIDAEVQAASMRGSLVARGFGAGTCAPGQPGAGSAECSEIARRAARRDDVANATIAAGVVTGLLAVGTGLAIGLENRGPGVKATVGPHGGGLIVHGSW